MSRLRNQLKRVPGLPAANLFVQSAALAMRLPRSPFIRSYPPGTFYSPIPAAEDIPARIDKSSKDVPGVDLREAEQLQLLQDLARSYTDLPFADHESTDRRFHLDNEYYSYFDAIVLYTMLRHSQPKRVVEVGSGFSSAVMLDTRDLFLARDTHLTFIDPYPERLESLLRPDDRGRCDVLAQKVQDVDLSVFTRLQAGDILFVDSSHVVKVGSDVAWIVFEILPRLAPGVLIHFHDIPYPFEYPLHWLRAGRAWNEAYVLRAFLQFNRDFEIRFFNDFMATFHADAVREQMPAALKPSSFALTVPASSLWLARR
jgi:predicted O-methyltransferase YrrM